MRINETLKENGMTVEKKIAQRRRGFTLTEAAIVLGIVGLILGAIWVAAASVYDNLRVTTTSNQLLQIVQSIRSMHATQNTIDPAIDAVLVAKAGGMPSDMVTRSAAGAVTNVRDVWAGDVEIDPYMYTVANDSFAVTFSAVPQGACSDLLVRNTGAGRDSGLVGAGNAASKTTPFPMTLTQAVAACSSTASTGNDVVFTFRLKT